MYFVYKDMREAIDVLSHTRSCSGVNPENLYVFARPYYDSTFVTTTSKAMKKYSAACGATNPENIRSTNLRKHIATMTQLLSLQENELDLLAGYMGHDIKVHSEFYRLPQNTMQLAKVSKVLLMMEQGSAGQFKEKSLDEIQHSCRRR